MAQPISFINQISSTPSLQNLSSVQNGAETGGTSFTQMLKNSIGQVNQTELTAQAAIEESLAGGEITQVEVFTAMKKADLSLRMLMQIRNKVISAYNEIKGMQL